MTEPHSSFEPRYGRKTTRSAYRPNEGTIVATKWLSTLAAAIEGMTNTRVAGRAGQTFASRCFILQLPPEGHVTPAWTRVCTLFRVSGFFDVSRTAPRGCKLGLSRKSGEGVPETPPALIGAGGLGRSRPLWLLLLASKVWSNRPHQGNMESWYGKIEAQVRHSSVKIYCKHSDREALSPRSCGWRRQGGA